MPGDQAERLGEVVCGVCEAPAALRRHVTRIANGTSVERCGRCGVTSLQPLPSEALLSSHYASYYLTRTSDDARQARLVTLHEPIVAQLTARAATARPVRFFDYGFGGGAFLRCVARQGNRAAGADLSTQNAQQLAISARTDGTEISVYDLSRQSLASLADTSFDVVTLFQVIEHVKNPLEVMRSLARLQPRGGLLYIECPNDSAGWARMKNLLHRLTRNNSWSSLKFPEHLHGFDRGSIRALFESAGYDLLDCGDYAYRDGVHQVESEFWWPRLSVRNRPKSPLEIVHSMVPILDGLMSKCLGAGSGLYGLGRRRG